MYLRGPYERGGALHWGQSVIETQRGKMVMDSNPAPFAACKEDTQIWDKTFNP